MTATPPDPTSSSANRQRARSPEKWRPSVFWLLALVVVPLVGFLAKIRIVGGDKLPREGAYVLAPNHYTEVDPLIVAVTVWRLGRAPRFMVKASLFKVPVLGAALRATGMVPVQRQASGTGTRDALGASETLAERGLGVIVYPEGTLTRDPDLWPMRGKTGAVRLALQADAPLVPMVHWGAQQIMGRYSKGLSLWPPRKRVTVVVGDPIDLSDLRERAHESSALIEGTTRLMNALADMLAEVRGEPAPAERWDPRSHEQSETGRYES